MKRGLEVVDAKSHKIAVLGNLHLSTFVEIIFYFGKICVTYLETIKALGNCVLNCKSGCLTNTSESNAVQGHGDGQ